MPHPLDTTFTRLALTPNAAAIDVLIAALDVADDDIRVRAVRALLKRRPTRGLVEVVRRLRTLPAEARDLVEDGAGVLSRALRDCLVSADIGLRDSALELIERFEDYSAIPVLAQLLEDASLADRAELEHVIYELAAGLYEHLQFGLEKEDAGSYLRDAQRIRHELLGALEAACHRFAAHRCRQVVEGLLLLGDPDNMHLKKLFRDGSEEVRGVAAELLCSSTHPGVMSLVVNSMAQNYPFHASFAAFQKRTDPEFICHLLRHWPRKVSPFQQKNLKEVHAVAWLEPDHMHLEAVPAALHRPLVAFLVATGLSEQQKFAVLEWIIQFGSPEGRLAATEVLADLEDDKVQEVVLGSLESDEPDVQAWAIKQLRPWSIPHAMELLIERLDSPVPEVQQAARDELAGFNIHRVLEIYDHLDRRTLLAIGTLVRKIDPDTAAKLRDDMLNAIRRKRIRAARGALAMNMHLDVADALVMMARDSDNLVRRTAAEVLGKVPTHESAAALAELARDASPRVRQAAEMSLSGMREVRREPGQQSSKHGQPVPVSQEGRE